MAREVRSPDNRIWRVERHWAVRLPVWIGPKSKREHGERQRSGPQDLVDWASDIAIFGFDDLPTPILIGIGLIVLAFIAVPVLIFLVDAVLIGLIVFVVSSARVMFRRPWQITARTGGPPPEEHSWAIPGLRNSARAMKEIASTLAASGMTGHHASTTEGGPT